MLQCPKPLKMNGKRRSPWSTLFTCGDDYHIIMCDDQPCIFWDLAPFPGSFVGKMDLCSMWMEMQKIQPQRKSVGGAV